MIAQHSNKCLDVQGGSTADGGNVYQWTYLNGTNQHWKFELISPPARVATQEKVEAATLKLSPNPADQLVTLAWSGLDEQAVTVTVVSTQGKTHSVQALKAGTASHQLSTAHLAPGLYLVKVKGKQSEVIQKLIITR